MPIKKIPAYAGMTGIFVDGKPFFGCKRVDIFAYWIKEFLGRSKL